MNTAVPVLSAQQVHCVLGFEGKLLITSLHNEKSVYCILIVVRWK